MVTAVVAFGCGKPMKPNSPVEVKSTFLGSGYYQDGKGVSRSSLTATLEQYPEAEEPLSGYTTKNTIGTLLAVPGGLLFGYGVGQLAAGGEPNWLVIGGGAALIAVSVPLSISAEGDLWEAVQIHNAKVGQGTELETWDPMPVWARESGAFRQRTW